LQGEQRPFDPAERAERARQNVAGTGRRQLARRLSELKQPTNLLAEVRANRGTSCARIETNGGGRAERLLTDQRRPATPGRVSFRFFRRYFNRNGGILAKDADAFGDLIGRLGLLGRVRATPLGRTSRSSASLQDALHAHVTDLVALSLHRGPRKRSMSWRRR